MIETNDISTEEMSGGGNIALVGVAIGISAYAWSLGFNFGAFGTIFLGHYIGVWLFSLSVLLLSVAIQRPLVPGNKLLGYIMLSLPSVWLLLRIADDSLSLGGVKELLLHGAELLVFVVSLPYLIYLFFYFTNPKILALQRKLIAVLLGIVLFIGMIGYTLGKYNHLIMSCENFVVSGQDTPENCVKHSE